MTAKAKEELVALLTRMTQMDETEVFERATEVGLQQMWREVVLERYLRGDISREEAVQEVGLDWVDMAERQWRAAQEDIQWALQQ